jgi:hypothetical protein
MHLQVYESLGYFLTLALALRALTEPTLDKIYYREGNAPGSSAEDGIRMNILIAMQ